MRLGQTLTVGVVVSALAGGGAHAGTSDASYQKAKQTLDAGIQAIGGLETLRAVKEVWRSGTGTNWAQGQSMKPDALITRAVEVKSFSDFANRKSATETVVSGAGALTARNRAVLQGDAGFNHNVVGGTLTAMAPGAIAGARNALRRDPAALLLTALGRAETLRSLSNDTIAFADTDGTQFALTFDATTHLLSKVETLGDNAVLGDALTELVLSEYKDFPAGGSTVKLPTRSVTRVAGDTTQDLKYAEVKLNAGAPADAFDAPKSAYTMAPAPAPGITTTKLGDDAYWVSGGTHHSWLVGFKDHVVVVEAPLNEDRSNAVMAKAAELFPGKPVRYVVMSHYHFDHSGGLRTYVAKGVTILTTPGNKAFLEKMAAAPHTIRPDAQEREKKKPVIETFTGKKTLTDGTRTLELIDVGPNPHVNEVLVAYLPKEKALFVADLLIIPLEGPWPPASPGLLDFDQKWKALGLAVDSFAPAHGRMGKPEDLKAGAAAKPAGN